jgi:glycosyltransferase involved in cell wall biosynthesis
VTDHTGFQVARTGHAGEPRTILFIVNVAWFFVSHRLPVARAARAAGYDVHLLTDVAATEELSLLTQEGVTVHRASLARGGLNPLADLRFLLRTLTIMRRVSPVLVHNVTVKPVIYGTWAARLVGVPGIINAISGFGYAFSHESRWLLARALRGAYRHLLRSPRVHVIFQNDDDASEFLRRGLVSQEQIVVIRGSGVDLSAYSPSEELLATEPLVVLPARMLRDKGVLEFAMAARRLRQRGCRARFVLAGPLDPSNRSALSAGEIADLTRDGSLDWLGQVKDMPELYRRAHIVCLPSYREGLPKSLIEACAAARPIVTTDVPGCRAVVAHEVNGLLVAPRDPAALADALQALLDSSALRKRFGAAGRTRAEREFGLEAVIAQTLQLYDKVVQTGAQHGGSAVNRGAAVRRRPQ